MGTTGVESPIPYSSFLILPVTGTRTHQRVQLFFYSLPNMINGYPRIKILLIQHIKLSKNSTPSDPKKESEKDFCKTTLEFFPSSTRTPESCAVVTRTKPSPGHPTRTCKPLALPLASRRRQDPLAVPPRCTSLPSPLCCVAPRHLPSPRQAPLHLPSPQREPSSTKKLDFYPSRRRITESGVGEA
jgi:hypothetical protein